MMCVEFTTYEQAGGGLAARYDGLRCTRWLAVQCPSADFLIPFNWVRRGKAMCHRLLGSLANLALVYVCSVGPA